MKRLFSLCLCVIMILTMMPLGASAAEDTSSERDELIALACEVFPEYADAIHRETTTISTFSRTSEADRVVFTETRDISSRESLTLAQYASGNVIVISQELDSFPITIVNSSTSDISNVGVSGTASFKMTGPGTGYFKLNNVAFTIYYNASDYFTNYGTSETENVGFGTINETTTKIEYNLVFNLSGTRFYAPFQLYFSNNKLVARTY